MLDGGGYDVTPLLADGRPGIAVAASVAPLVSLAVPVDDRGDLVAGP
jgi:hypothetical protein